MTEALINLLIGTGLIMLLLIIYYPQKGILAYFRKYQKLNSKELFDDLLKVTMKLEMDNHIPTVINLSASLGINHSKLENALDQMEQKGLLSVQEQNVHLSAEGQKFALQLIRAHRLWELYLADETGHAEDDWHTLAESKEHKLTPNEVNELSNRMGNPLFDPHGDPIPTHEGEIGCEQGDCIYSYSINETLVIKHIEDEPPAVYSQLIAEGFFIGMVVRIIEKTDNRMVLAGSDQEIVLAKVVANNLSVMPLEDDEEIIEIKGDALYSLKNGELGKIVAISSRIRGQERRRLLDMGILPGTQVELDITSPLGDPKGYTIRGAVIALRNEQAEHIKIEKVQVLES